MAGLFAERWFEELGEGERHRTRGRTITEADVVTFAGLTGDFNPQHVDAHWAAQSFYGERIAHGALILSYALGSMPMQPERVLAVRGIKDVVFKRATHLGDTIHSSVSIQRLRDVAPGFGLVGLGLRTSDQDERVVMRGRFEVLWRKRPLPAGAAAEEAEG
jgi:3-hydroxybutyryl-CoA dehydratase